MIQARGLWLILASSAILGTLGCGQVNAPAARVVSPGIETGGAYHVQQETGTAICNRRYRLCLRTLVRELGSQAIEICQERRDRCIDALGEGFFTRR